MSRFAESLQQQFPTPDFDAWRRQVERELRGAALTSRHWRPEPGIDVPPFSAPGAPEYAHEVMLRSLLAARNSAGFVARERVLATSTEAVSTAVSEACADGVAEIELALGVEGASAQRATAEATLQAQPADTRPRLILQPAVDGRWPLTSRKQSALDGSDSASEVALDIFAVGYRQPDLDLEHAKTQLVSALHDSAWKRSVAADAAVWHDAGAWTSDELALTLGSAVAALRAANDAGVPPDEFAQKLAFRFPMDQELWVSGAKLRAARVLWSLVATRAGIAIDVAAQVPFVAVVGGRMRAASHDTYTNLLRTTLGSVAATIGCADIVAVEPFTVQPSRQTAEARRLARRQLQLLRDESFLDVVIDPGGGARQLENLTDQLARKALDSLRDLEANGGLAKLLDSPELNERLRSAKAHREVSMRTGQRALLGINRFADPSLESPSGSAEQEAAAADTPEDVLRRASTDGFAFERLRRALTPALPQAVASQSVALWCCGDPKSLQSSVARARDGLRILGWPAPPEPVPVAGDAIRNASLDDATNLLLVAADEDQQAGLAERLRSILGNRTPPPPAIVWLDGTPDAPGEHSWSWPDHGDTVLALARITRHLLRHAGHEIPDDIQTWCSLDAGKPEQFLTTITESDA